MKVLYKDCLFNDFGPLWKSRSDARHVGEYMEAVLNCGETAWA